MNITATNRIDEFKRTIREAVATGLYQFGNMVMEISKRERVPVDTGALMNSGYVALPEDNGTEISVTMGYGGQSVDYALVVHENMNPHVHWKRPGSGPKYLENPLKESQDKMPDVVGDAVQKALG